jgi:flagellar basal-body rod protein FlgB
MIDLFSRLGMTQRSLDFHLRRHSVLTSNIANSETPGYRALDLSFDSFLTRAERLRCTQPQHMSVGGSVEANQQIFDDSAASPGNDGNTVSMEREMAKVTANSIRYKANVQILTRRLAMLKYAATDGRR